MRRTILAGLILVLVTGLTVLIGESLGLDVQSVALLGVATGAVVGLVPDQTTSRRLASFAVGFAAAFVGYLFRAAVTPDTAGGRAVVAAVVVALCVGVVAISAGRLPLWSALLGGASLAGAYEFTYSQAPTRVLDTSVSSATTLLLCVAVGFLVTAVVADPTPPRVPGPPSADDPTPLDEMMETNK